MVSQKLSLAWNGCKTKMGHLKNMVSSWLTKANIENYHHKKLTLSQKISLTGSIFLLVIKMSQPTPPPPSTRNNVSLLFHKSIRQSMYQISQKCKIDMAWHIKSVFSELALLLGVWQRNFSQNWADQWNKEIHHSRKYSPFTAC